MSDRHQVSAFFFCVSFLCNMQLRIAYYTFPSCFLLYKWATPRRKKDGRPRRIWRRPPHRPSNRLAAPVLLHRRSVVKTANKIIYNKENIHQMEMKPLGAARQPCCRFSSNWPIASFLFLVLLYIYIRIHNSGMFLCLWLFVLFVCFFCQFFSQMCLFLIKFLKQLIQHYIHVMFSFSLLLGSVFPFPL